MPAAQVAAALAALDADVFCLQEVDVAQPRSHRAHQVEVAAEALRAPYWRFAPALTGTPSPWRTWHRLVPHTRDAGGPADRPMFGNAVLSRRPVRAWHVLGLGSGRARLPLRAPGPDGAARWWWVPDEPRVALAAELDGVTVVSTHLSYSPPTAVRQLLRLRAWTARLPGPVVVAGDLNLPGGLPARLLGGRGLVAGPTYPAVDPRLQLDHVLALPSAGPVTAVASRTQRLDVGDHLAVVASLRL
jgi:endonuclease/exonuclease/phosphatase family metal-dependent hydrolase